MAENKPSEELALSTSNRTNASDDSAKIDKELLIDVDQLAIGLIISEGTFSIVYEGSYKSMPVAIKVIQSNSVSTLSTETELQEKFRREVSMLSRVNHDNIVKFIGASEEPKMMIITELMRGGTLQKYLWSLSPNCPPLKVSITYALQISQAVEYLHQNRIIHHDIKACNLLLTEDKKKIKIADFGLAREEADEDMNTESETNSWKVPELFSTKALLFGVKKRYDYKIDPKVDVYCFLRVLWQLLTNNAPFKGNNNVTKMLWNRHPIMDEVPEQFVPLLEACWAENPEDIPKISQVTKFLEKILESIWESENTLPKSQPSSIETVWERNEENEDTPAADSSMDSGSKETKKKSKKSLCIRFPSCFGH